MQAFKQAKNIHVKTCFIEMAKQWTLDMKNDDRDRTNNIHHTLANANRQNQVSCKSSAWLSVDSQKLPIVHNSLKIVDLVLVVLVVHTSILNACMDG